MCQSSRVLIYCMITLEKQDMQLLLQGHVDVRCDHSHLQVSSVPSSCRACNGTFLVFLTSLSNARKTPALTMLLCILALMVCMQALFIDYVRTSKRLPCFVSSSTSVHGEHLV
jgi:hypothetical protein